MCAVSMIMDHYREKWQPVVPQVPMPYPVPVPFPQFPPQQQVVIAPQISQAEIDEFRKLLERAREYDKRHNEPDCELEEKRTVLLAIAKALGIDISFVLPSDGA